MGWNCLRIQPGPQFVWQRERGVQRAGRKRQRETPNHDAATFFLPPITGISLHLSLFKITFSTAQKSGLCVCPFLSTLNNVVVLRFLLGNLNPHTLGSLSEPGLTVNCVHYGRGSNYTIWTNCGRKKQRAIFLEYFWKKPCSREESYRWFSIFSLGQLGGDKFLDSSELETGGMWCYLGVGQQHSKKQCKKQKAIWPAHCLCLHCCAFKWCIALAFLSGACGGKCQQFLSCLGMLCAPVQFSLALTLWISLSVAQIRPVALDSAVQCRLSCNWQVHFSGDLFVNLEFPFPCFSKKLSTWLAWGLLIHQVGNKKRLFIC